MAPGDRVWLTIDYRPPHQFGRRYDLAKHLRTEFRAAGLDACFFSLREPLEELLADAGSVVFPVEEAYPPDDRKTFPEVLRKVFAERGIPFIGSGYPALLTAGDRREGKRRIAAAGLAVPTGTWLDGTADGPALRRLLGGQTFPAVAKPVSGPGASLGVVYLPDAEALARYAESWRAAGASPVLLEEYVDGQEMTVWVWGVEPDVRAAGVFVLDKGGEPIFDHDMKIGFKRVPGFAPPEEGCDPEGVRRAADAAVAAHRAVGAYSYSRVDLILRQGEPVVLEVNPHPKVITHPRSGLAAGLGRPLGEILDVLIGHARARPAAEGV